MTPPFILRFQENCAEIDGSQSASGTQTQTFTRAEQADPDVEQSSYTAIKPQDASAGTPTKSATAVRAEHSDEDRAYCSFRLMPVESALLSGTQTHTRMRAEEADEDRGGRHSRIIPSCSSS